jgi:hypothetical protein
MAPSTANPAIVAEGLVLPDKDSRGCDPGGQQHPCWLLDIDPAARYILPLKLFLKELC